MPSKLCEERGASRASRPKVRLARRHGAMVSWMGLVALYSAVPGAAQAFPAWEGVSTTSALIGAASTLLATLAPSALNDRFGRLAASLISALILICAVLSVLLYREVSNDRAVMEHARKAMPSEGLEIPWLQDLPPPKAPSSEDIAWARSKDLLLDLDAYRSGQVARQAQVVYVSRDGTEKFQPSHVPAVSPNEYGLLPGMAAEHDGELLLVSESLGDVIAAARRLFEAGYTATRGALLEGPQPPRLARDLPYLAEPESVFDERLIDISPVQALSNSHGLLANAVSRPASDFMVMRDSALRTEIEWPVVFMGRTEAQYATLDARLRAAGFVPGTDYRFYPGGLQAHIDARRMAVVPFHYNLRLADPKMLMQVAFLTDRLRLICVDPDQCLKNIPAGMRIDIPFAQLDRGELRQRIDALDRDSIYTVVSSNNASSNAALTTGWWLISSGHDYVGELVLQERFSADRLWFDMQKRFGEDTNLEDWREALSWQMRALDLLARWVEKAGPLAAFLFLGALLRLTLMPVAMLAERGYPRAARPVYTLLAQLLTLGAVMLGFTLAELAISYFAVVPHAQMQAFMLSGSATLDDVLAVLIGLHILALAPRLSRGPIALLALPVGLWAFGTLDNIPDPMAMFLIGGEAIVLLFQVRPILRRLKEAREAQAGVIRPGRLGQEAGPLPDKWARANRFAPQPGFLVDIDRAHLDRVTAAACALPSERVILRSAGLGAEEQELGGYYQSAVVPRAPDAITAGMKALRDSGCEQCWVQPFTVFEEVAVVSSIGPQGERGYVYSGPPEAASEGRRTARSYSLDQAGRAPTTRRLKRLLRSVERHEGGPVILEVGLSKGAPRLLQIRAQSRAFCPASAFFPDGLSGYRLAEDYLARCSHFTGSVLEHVSGGDLAWVRGFLYRRRQRRVAALPISRAGMGRLEQRLLALTSQGAPAEPRTPASALAGLREALAIHRGIYRVSQARLRPRHFASALTSACWSGETGAELEMTCGRQICPPAPGAAAPQRETREVLHDWAVLNGLLIARFAAQLLGAADLPRAHVLACLEPGFVPERAVIDPLPMTGGRDRSILVSGPIRGTIWPSRRGAPPSGATDLVLTGEEIGSEWVPCLGQFSGVLCAYGDASSHLGLSAARLGIPMRLLPAAEIGALDQDAHIDLA